MPCASVAADAASIRRRRSARSASSARGARIGARTVIHPHVVIGDGTTIGADCVLHAHVSIRERCTIGARVILQNGAVIGSDGYGFAQRADGTHEKIPQTAPVVIEDDVEIGANTTIDRPAVGETRIKAGTKIDNLVQIAPRRHPRPERRCWPRRSASPAARSLGDNVQFGGQVGVGGHLTIGDGVKAVGQTGITNSVDAGEFVSGYPAIDNREWRRSSVGVPEAAGDAQAAARARGTLAGARRDKETNNE